MFTLSCPRQRDAGSPLAKSSSQRTQAGSQTSTHDVIDDDDGDADDDGNGDFSDPCDSETEPSHLLVRPTSNKACK